MPRRAPAIHPTAAEVLAQLNQGLQLYLDPTLCNPKQWAAGSNTFSGPFGFLQRSRFANVVTGDTFGYTPTGERFTSLKFFASPGIGNYLLGDIAGLMYSFDSGNNYAAVTRPHIGNNFTSADPARNGPWSRETLQNIVYEMNGQVKQTGRQANAATVENWGLNTPDVSPQVVISSGSSQNITAISRLNGVVTVTLAGALVVPGGNGVGMVNVKNVLDLGFTGTFVVATGSGTATLTWLQEGLNTSSSAGTVDTNILKSIGRSYSYAWENENKPHVSAPSPATQFIQYQNQNGVIQLIEQGTITIANLSTNVTGLGTAFTSAWVGRGIWIETTTGPFIYTVAAVLSPTQLTLDQNWLGPTGTNLRFQIYDLDVTNIRLYQTADGGPTYFRVQRNAFVRTNGTLLGAGLQFFDNANSEPPFFPFTTEVSQLNNVPPPVGAFVKEYQGVLLVYGGTIPGQTFFYSNQTLTTVGLQQESFAPLNQITLPIQNASINGMVELPGALIIWSDKQDMFRLTGLLSDNTAAATPTQQGATITALPYNLGCATPFAVALTPLGVIWVTSNAEVWLFTDSYAPRNIGQPIQSILKSVDPADLNKCRMSYYHNHNRNWVLLSVPVVGASQTNTILVLDLDLLTSNGSPSYYVFDMAQNQPVWYQLDVPASTPDTITNPISQTFQFSGGPVELGSPFTFTLPVVVQANDEVTFSVELTTHTPAPDSVTDQLGNTYTLISHQVGGGGDTRSFSVYNSRITIGGSAQITVEVTTGSAAAILVMGVGLMGAGPIETTSPVNNTGSSPAWPSEPLTPSTPNAIMLAFDSAYGPPSMTTDEFTIIQSANVDSPAVQNAVAYRIVTSAGTYTSSWSQNVSAQWNTVLVGFPITSQFQPAVGPGAVPLETVYETQGVVRTMAGSLDIITDLDYQRGSGIEIPVVGAGVTTQAWGNDSPFIIKRPKFFRFNTNRDPSQLANEVIVGIISAARTVGTVTVTTDAAHGLAPGDWIFVQVTNDITFNGAFQVVAVPTTTSLTYAQALPDGVGTGGTLTSGWNFHVLGIDDDFYGFDNPLDLALVPGLNDTASLGGNPAAFQFGTPFRTSQELYRVGGVNFVMGRRLQFRVNFPSTVGVDFAFRSIQIGFGPSPPR